MALWGRGAGGGDVTTDGPGAGRYILALCRLSFSMVGFWGGGGLGIAVCCLPPAAHDDWFYYGQLAFVEPILDTMVQKKCCTGEILCCGIVVTGAMLPPRPYGSCTTTSRPLAFIIS